MSERNKRKYGGSARVYPEGLHVRQMDGRKWVLFDGTDMVKGVGVFHSEREALEYIDRQKLMAANVGPEWGYI